MTLHEFQKQTKTKYISSDRVGTPSLENEYGSLNNLLKKILVEGYNPREALGLAFDPLNSLITIELPLNHGFYLNQVIAVSGLEHVELNKEFRIVETDLTTIKVFSENLGKYDSEISTTFVVKGAPLGFSTVYNNQEEGVSCFKVGRGSSGILKVVDALPPNQYEQTWAKFARVSFGTELDSAGYFKDNIKSPFHPDYPNSDLYGNNVQGATGIHGFAKWDYAISSNTYNFTEVNISKGVFPTDWRIVGDDKTFYLMIRSMGRANYSYNLLGYGDYATYNPLETTNQCLQARDGFYAANSADSSNFARSRQSFGVLESENSGFILSDIYGNIKRTVDYNRYRNGGAYFNTSDFHRPWKSSYVTGLHPLTGQLFTEKLYIVDRELYLRGHHRGISITYGKDRYLSQDPTSNGSFSLDVQEPITSSTFLEMPIFFTLQDWEDS